MAEASPPIAIAELRRWLERADGVALAPGRGDEAAHGGRGPDCRERKALQVQPRDIYIPDLHIDTLKVKARFR